MDWIYEYYMVMVSGFFFSLGISLFFIAKWIGSEDQGMKKLSRALRTVGLLIILGMGWILLMQYLGESP